MSSGNSSVGHTLRHLKKTTLNIRSLSDWQGHQSWRTWMRDCLPITLPEDRGDASRPGRSWWKQERRHAIWELVALAWGPLFPWACVSSVHSIYSHNGIHQVHEAHVPVAGARNTSSGVKLSGLETEEQNTQSKRALSTGSVCQEQDGSLTREQRGEQICPGLAGGQQGSLPMGGAPGDLPRSVQKEGWGRSSRKSEVEGRV